MTETRQIAFLEMHCSYFIMVYKHACNISPSIAVEKRQLISVFFMKEGEQMINYAKRKA